MTSKLFNFVFIALFTLLIIWGVGWLWFATSITMTENNKTVTKTDAIIVLTGGRGRINEGLNLLAQKTAPALFISGVHKDVTKKDILKSWQNSTPSKLCCISLGYQSTDTISNAIEVRQWVVKNDINSFHLVTSSYHMPRAFMEISQQLPHTIIIKHPVFPSDFQLGGARFWKLTFSEYNKRILRWMQNINKKSENP